MIPFLSQSLFSRFAYSSITTPLFAEPGEIITLEIQNMGDSIVEGEITDIFFEPGDQVGSDENIIEISTGKATQFITANEGPGIIKEILVNNEDTVRVGTPAVVMEITEEIEEDSDIEEVAPPAATQAAAAAAVPPPTSAPKQTSSKPKPAPTPAPVTFTGAGRSETRSKMSPMRRQIAQRLKDSQNTAALLTTFQELDMHNIMSLRSQYKDQFLEKHGVKLGFMSAFVKASGQALKESPIVNASIDPETNQHIIYRDYVDISVAVSTPTGLVVPVLRDVDKMTFADVEKSIVGYATKARDGSLTMEEMTGGNFTISNGGVYGSMLGTPILNPPQSSILGMHGIVQRPVVRNGEIVIRPIMQLALTYDHRLIDGRDAVTFLCRIRDLVEDPQRLILDV